jgi:tRNA modification GTPase
VETGRGDLSTDGRLRVVLCGPSNAGKSTLLNRLSGRELALTYHEPGTTRDPVMADISVGGIQFSITDTAGIDKPNSAAPPQEQTPGPSEQIGRQAKRQARELARRGELVLAVLDRSRPLAPDWLELMATIESGRLIAVLNKSDLAPAFGPEDLKKEVACGEIVPVSALTGRGIEELGSALGRVVWEGRLDASAADCLFNARQREAVRRTIGALERAEQAVRDGLGYEFAALDLREATDALGEVTGRVESQQVLDRVFSRFCIGK